MDNDSKGEGGSESEPETKSEPRCCKRAELDETKMGI